VLETQHIDSATKLQEISDTVATIDGKVDAINQKLARQAGFMAGVMAILLPIWSGVTLVVGAMWDKITESGGP
jgi:hypothetical protein